MRSPMSTAQNLKQKPSSVNQFQDILDAQKKLFATGVTRSFDWRVDQLNRMGKMISENEAALQKAMQQEFKTATQEYISDTQGCLLETEYQKSQLNNWIKPEKAPVPRHLAATGHPALVYR